MLEHTIFIAFKYARKLFFYRLPHGPFLFINCDFDGTFVRDNVWYHFDSVHKSSCTNRYRQLTRIYLSDVYGKMCKSVKLYNILMNFTSKKKKKSTESINVMPCKYTLCPLHNLDIDKFRAEFPRNMHTYCHFFRFQFFWMFQKIFDSRSINFQRDSVNQEVELRKIS